MRVFFRIVIVLLLSLTVPFGVFAHELKTDGSIGAVLHVSPDDDPIIGVESGIFFDLKDREGTFKPEQCECIGSILQNGKEIYTQPIFQGIANPSLDDAAFFYTFLQKNVYTIRLSGKPNISGSFEPFVLDWDIRVERESSGQSQQSNNAISPIILYLIGGIILFGGLLGMIIRIRRR